MAAQADAWLCPMDDADGGGSGRPTVLGIGTDGYLALVDWTGRSLAKGRRGALPVELRPILEDLDVEVERWVGTVRDYGGMFHRVAGKVASLERKAEALGQRWLAGVRASREVFRSGGALA